MKMCCAPAHQQSHFISRMSLQIINFPGFQASQLDLNYEVNFIRLMPVKDRQEFFRKECARFAEMPKKAKICSSNVSSLHDTCAEKKCMHPIHVFLLLQKRNKHLSLSTSFSSRRAYFLAKILSGSLVII